MFIAALLTIAKRWEQPKCPPTEWISKMWSIHTMEHYSVLKREDILASVTIRMNLEDLGLSKI